MLEMTSEMALTRKPVVWKILKKFSSLAHTKSVDTDVMMA